MLEDLKKLLSKRQEIENLQATLQSVIMQSGNKKIDVDDLKQRIVDSVKGGIKSTIGNSGKYSTAELSHFGASVKENKRSNKSKSPGNHLGNKGMSFDEYPEKGSAVKDQSMNAGDNPAWYRALKKNLN